jgi:hypothetical protein
VTQLRNAYGAALRSVVLYGSAAAGEHIANRSDYNVLVLLDAFDLEQLAAASATARAWAEAGNHAPLTMTMREWRGSSDIFPMEYADILDRHRVLYGEPPFDGIRVSAGDLRLQLEQEAMGKLLRLRQGLLASGSDAQRQIELLGAAWSAIMVIFRAFLRLHAEQPSQDNAVIVQAAAKRAGFQPEPFLRVLAHVRGQTPLTAGEVATVLAGFMSGMERLVEYIDRYEPV